MNNFKKTNSKSTADYQENLDNIKYFLESYKYSNDLSKLSNFFQKNSSIFSEKSLIPESYKKIRIPFNKTKAFYDISNCCIQGEEPIIYPKSPIILSDMCQLEQIKNNKLQSEKVIFSRFFHKCYSIEIFKNKKKYFYGPYSIEKIYDFLNEIYDKMNEKEKKDYQIIIVDLSVNFRHLPQELYLQLKEEINKQKEEYEKQIQKKENNEKVNPIESDLDEKF